MAGEAIPTAQLRVFLLGRVRIETEAGEHIDPGPPKCQELLAALALEPRVAITVGRLVGLLWGVNPPRTAEKTLQTYVARLRKALGPDAIVRTGSAYRLDMDPTAIDTHRFRSALRRGDTETALKEWTGTPLAGVDADGLRPVLEGLVEEWLDAVESDLERAVEVDPGATTGRLTELVAAHPFREGMWALLMTALYRTGRQAEALDAFRRARSTLVDELGVEPGPQLRELEQLILHQDEQLVAGRGARRRSGLERSIPAGTITFGFAELDGVAALWSAHPAHAADVIAEFEASARAAASDRNGFVFTGGVDTVGVAFENASDAASWSIELHESMSHRDWPHNAAVQARVGLHTGQADERNGSYYGPNVSIANRLAVLSNPGQTIATSVTALLSGLDEQTDLGTFVLEGASAEHTLCQIGSGTFASLRSSTSGYAQLPRSSNQLIGRDDLVTTVIGALAGSPVVTLIGPGGIGKTRLALEVARRDRITTIDGVWFVGLADVAESCDVARSLADTIGVQESAEQSVLDAIVGALRSRAGLVVLDNCEHVVDGANALVAALADRCPRLTVLTTSREGLGLPAERLIAVGPLDIDDASVQLFAERSLAIDHTFDVEGNRRSIQLICRRLDGVPLAIELAAARVRSLAPADLLARLDDNFRLLTGARRSTIERHRTLRATIQWSYDLLSEREQLLLRRLSVFSGPFDLLAAEMVISDDAITAVEVSLLMGDLIDQSMCTVESGTSGRRFRLLAPIRQFAFEEHLLGDPDQALQQRHATHMRDRVQQIGVLLAGPKEIEGATELTELWPNIRSAVDWAIDQQKLDLASELTEPIAVQGFFRRGLGELRDWIARIIEVAARSDATIATRVVADGLLWTALYSELTENQADFDRLVEHFGEPDLLSARLARLIVNGDSAALVDALPQGIAHARERNNMLLADLFDVLIVGNLLSSGRLDEAETHAHGVLERAQDTMAPTSLNWLLYMAATARAIRGDAAGADVLFERIVLLPLPPRTNSPNESLAARRAARQGDHAGAYAILRTHIDDLVDVENFNGIVVVALEFLNIMVSTGNLDPAGFILGYFDNSDLVGVGNDGFKALLEEPGRLIADDSQASELRAETAARQPDVQDATDYMVATLDRLLQS